MAITASRVFRTINRIRYRINATAGAGESVEITSTGAATPDLQTDSLPGPIKNISKVKANGYGKIAVGGITTQAQARALLLSDDAAAQVGPGIPTLMCRLTQQSTTTGNFDVDADQGTGDNATPSIVITANGIGTALLDVILPYGVGLNNMGS